MPQLSPLERIEFAVGLISTLLGVLGYVAGARTIELLGVLGAVFCFAIVVTVIAIKRSEDR